MCESNSSKTQKPRKVNFICETATINNNVLTDSKKQPTPCYSNSRFSCFPGKIQKARVAERPGNANKQVPARPDWKVPLKAYTPTHHKVITWKQYPQFHSG